MKNCPSCLANYAANFTHCPRDGSALVEAGAWKEGTVVRGKYRILAKVGQGGMAAVYKAVHVQFEELRALKIMNEDLARDRAFVKRFMGEAVLTRKLQHPSAVRVDDIDEAEDGRPFIVMEYVEGRGLKEAIEAEAPMPAARVCPLIRQVAGALDAAHRMGIVHRDVKPANIVLISGGEPERAKLLDFGIAKIKETRLDHPTRGTTLTGTGSVIGTPAYMSPEQAKGLRGDQLDGRSDLYSLGIVMYEMLLGGLPFKADTSMQWILAHLQTPPRPLWEARPDLQIPWAIAGVVMRCLEKDPQMRPPNATALIGEIEWAEHAAGLSVANAGTDLGAYSVPAARMPQPEPQQPLFSEDLNRAAANPASPFPPAARDTRPRVTRAGGGYDLSAMAQPSSSWIGWLTASIAGIVVAAAVGWWLFWPHAAPPTDAGAVAIPHASDSHPSTATDGAGAAAALGTASETNDNAHGIPAPADVNAAPSRGDLPSTNAPIQSGTEADSPDQRPTRSGPGTSGVHKASSPRREPQAAPRSPGFAEALLRARDDENQGKFEDALREYEQASALDPSDAALKQHIRRLREQVAKENELIH